MLKMNLSVKRRLHFSSWVGDNRLLFLLAVVLRIEFTFVWILSDQKIFASENPLGALSSLDLFKLKLRFHFCRGQPFVWPPFGHSALKLQINGELRWWLSLFIEVFPSHEINKAQPGWLDSVGGLGYFAYQSTFSRIVVLPGSPLEE